MVCIAVEQTEQCSFMKRFSIARGWEKDSLTRWGLFFKWMTNTQMVELYNSYPNTQGKEWYTLNCSFFTQLIVKVFDMIKVFWVEDEYSNGRAIRLVSKYSEKKRYTPNYSFFNHFNYKKILTRNGFWLWKRIGTSRVKSFKRMMNARVVEQYNSYSNNRGK